MRTDPDYNTQEKNIDISVDSEQCSQKKRSCGKCTTSVLNFNSQKISDTVFQTFFTINPNIPVIGSGLSMNNCISVCLGIESKTSKYEDNALIQVLPV